MAEWSLDEAQQRVETDPLGRAALSGFILFVFLALLSSNLPDSHLQRTITDLVRPARDAVGLDQTWSVFAPNPRTTILGMEAHLEYADGTQRVWRIPRGDNLIAPYRTYRWHKWSEWTRSDDHQLLWRPLAEWLARTQVVDGQAPVTVTLSRSWQDLRAPGTAEPGPPRQEYVFFTYQVVAEHQETSG